MKYEDCKNFTLEADSVEVVLDVLSVSEVEKLRDTMWKWLNHKTKYLNKPVVQKDPSTYVSLFDLYPKHGMLFQHWDFGHNPLSWTVRQNRKVIDVFSRIWNTDRLLTSFDGISISLPCEITHRGWNCGREWFHVDQSYRRNRFECVQGLVNVFDVEEGDATLRILRKSHLLHKKFQEVFQIAHSSDWCLLTPLQKQFYIDQLGSESDTCILASSGSLVLWDSRTVHQGVEPQRSRSRPNIRCTPYVCMTPASLATPSQLQKRIKYFEERRTCNHCPHKVKVFAKEPRTFGRSVPRVNAENIRVTSLMKDLVGYSYV